MTLNSTLLMPPLTKKRSPFLTGLYASMKYGLRYVSNRLPVIPSMVSSIGRMWTLFPYLTSVHWCTDTTSPSLTLKFLRTTLFILIFGSSHDSSARTMHTVSRLFFPLRSTVSPLKSSSSSIVFGFRLITEFSSFMASSTTSLLGDFFRSIIAVETSFFAFPGLRDARPKRG